MQFRSILTLTLVLGLFAGGSAATVGDLSTYRPPMRWDQHPDAADWTRQTLLAVAAHDAELASRVPKDIATFCPHYAKASLNERRAFWVGLLSATAKHESGFNAAVVGGGGRYIGLMQISLPTAKHYDCSAGTSAALKDGTDNLACAVDIFAPHVAADGVVAGTGNRGIGRDWGPYHKAKARAEIAGWTAKQSYCQG